MKKLLFLLAMLVALTASAKRKVYNFQVTNADGKQVSLKAYRGKVLLIVNTATRCGFTPQYAELESLYEKYHDQGLEILDFPCNQFGAQAPGTVAEIRQFCTANYGTQFEQFDKIDVNGPSASPLFTFLKSQQPFKGFDLNDRTGQMLDNMMRKKDSHYDKSADVKWNFTKFLVDKKGRVVGRYEPTDKMSDLESAIVDLLKK